MKFRRVLVRFSVVAFFFSYAAHAPATQESPIDSKLEIVEKRRVKGVNLRFFSAQHAVVASAISTRPLQEWGAEERSRVVDAFKSDSVSEQFLRASALGQSVDLYRLADESDQGFCSEIEANAVASPFGIFFNRNYLHSTRTVQQMVLLHELAHLNDRFGRMSWSRDWICYFNNEKKSGFKAGFYRLDESGHYRKVSPLAPSPYSLRGLEEGFAEYVRAYAGNEDFHGRAQFAKDFWRKVCSFSKNDVLIASTLRLGLAAYNQHHYQEALESFRKITFVDGANVTALFYSLKCEYYLSDFKQALEIAERLESVLNNLAAPPQELLVSEFRTTYASCLIQCKQFTKASAVINLGLKYSPDDIKLKALRTELEDKPRQ